MVSNPQIMSDLRLVMEMKHDLELMNTYKGVPFICKARVQSIEDDLVQMEAHEPGLVCIEREKQTKVLGSDYFEPSMAQVVSVDFTTGKILLNKFSYLGTKLGERMIVRVEPKDPVNVAIQSEKKKTPGHLADLSLSGIGIFIDISDYLPSLKPGTTVMISMQLPNGEITLDGTILSAVKINECYRLSVRFAPNGQQQKIIIFHYLVERRVEIETELRREFEKTIATAQAG
jgi:hypothetical protein